MADEPTTNDVAQLTVQDLVRLKHRLGKSITWGTSRLNALEVEELTRLRASDYVEIRKDYRKWQQWISSYVLLAFLVASLIASTILHGLVRYVAWGVAFVCAYSLIRREGHAEGYIDGYSGGFEAGAYKALGITKEEVTEMAEKATEMKIDELLVQKMNERAAPSDDSGLAQSDGKHSIHS